MRPKGVILRGDMSHGRCAICDSRNVYYFGRDRRLNYKFFCPRHVSESLLDDRVNCEAHYSYTTGQLSAATTGWMCGLCWSTIEAMAVNNGT